MSQESGAPVAVKARRGLLITGIVLIVVSIVLGIVGAVQIFSAGSGIGDLFSSTPHPTPYQSTRDLSRGIYFVYQDTGNAAQIPISDVSVNDSNGVGVSVYEPAVNENVTINGVTYSDVAGFKITAAGSYRIAIATNDATVIIAPSLGHAVAAVIPGIALGVLAGILFIVGLVLFIIGVVKASSRKNKTPRPTLAVPAAEGVWPMGPGYAPVELTEQFPVQQPAPANPYATPAQPVPPAQPVTPSPTPEPAPAPTPPPVTPPPVQPPAGPPPGWYPDPDPSRPGGRRYWDGTAWTHYTA